MVLSIVAIRTFVSPEIMTLPEEYFTRNLGWAVVNLLLGGFFFALIVGVGFILLIIPGVFLLVSLYFWNFVVIVEDKNFITGLKRSWNLTKGDRLKLFVLGLIVGIVSIVVGSIGLVLQGNTPQLVATLALPVISAPVGVASMTIPVQAFNQLREY